MLSDVGLESIKTIRANPLKSSIYGSFGAFLYGCVKNNPDHLNFLEQLTKSEQQVAMVPITAQNPVAVEYLKELERCRNNDTLRITSLGFFSIMWKHDNASALSTYDATCDYLKPELRTFHQRIIDIGFWNNWWNLEKQLKDYDVNF